MTGPYRHSGLSDDSTETVTEIITAVREAVGPDFTLMVDVQYAFDDAAKVAAMVLEWQRQVLNRFACCP